MDSDVTERPTDRCSAVFGRYHRMVQHISYFYTSLMPMIQLGASYCTVF